MGFSSCGSGALEFAASQLWGMGYHMWDLPDQGRPVSPPLQRRSLSTKGVFFGKQFFKRNFYQLLEKKGKKYE